MVDHQSSFEKSPEWKHPSLPPPISVASTSDRPRPYRRIYFYVLLTILVLLYHNNLPFTLDEYLQNITIEEDAYLSGLVDKGLIQALPLPPKHHNGPCRNDDVFHYFPKLPGSKPPVIIPPKLAEKIYLRVPNNDSCRAALRKYTKRPHPAGSGFDLITALEVKNEWETVLGLPTSGADEHLYDAGSPESQSRVREGMDEMGVWIDQYYPVMNEPVSSSLTLLSDPPFHAKLQEDIVGDDPDSIYRDSVPVFHGLSVSGDVTAQYVYVGYGRKSDFELLESKGVNVSGRIVLTKYGGPFRGLKVKAAQEAGAVGCLIFTDPGDDGEITEANGYKAYPDGPARQPSSVQRGSVQFVSLLQTLYQPILAGKEKGPFISAYPGDPTTPGVPAYPNATRLEVGNQPSIPSLPISFEDAIPLLKALYGEGLAVETLGPEWSGGLTHYNVSYFTGPSQISLHMVNQVNTRVMPIWNVMATIPGHITDEVIIMGNHRDAWVMGASDPNSGTASQHELIRGLGELIKIGWKPLRTIMFVSWDAEEYGLIGSTEWCEDFGDWLGKNVIAYLNLDSSVSGSKYRVQGSPSLAWLIKITSQEILSSSNSSRTIWHTRKDGGDWSEYLSQTSNFDGFITPNDSDWTGVSPLGSGSDYTPFLQRYGIASTSLGFSSGPKDPVYHYHSTYDTFTWMEKYGDPGFHKHVDVAKVMGLLVLRLADGLLLPFNTTQYARDLRWYLRTVELEIRKANFSEKIELGELRKSINELENVSKELDREKERVIKELKGLLGHDKWWGWERMKQMVTSTIQSFVKYPKRPNGRNGMLEERRGLPLPSPGKIKKIKQLLKEIRKINVKLQYFESGFLSSKGLKGRQWYKHKIVAPGLWKGYGATTFPSLTEAITLDRSPLEAQTEADELTLMIRLMADHLSS
ncbi:hypothetical protein TREMEDRAFT_29057 [Tremella mesenterica DSM 1558]|uniref:uncharacterized protein n=1 Tax=Tremella mesenterica (strain ATCC 24925 / CBS 8224 / DSM 1558 / NBRC 9311 / NRRL Y-6157 / RJB 2259-6 / UBC 559-6) TaxID=578456 RepID=UPI0003F4A42F|nr:uncharacterized protein TREMEDRAFT_29057 [Tremella mesenterica DSM 1558]EIW70651.1 hypothetical protein TREMEDRAFT_29057 [Tremella mesenterica DSM 1558]